MTAATARTLAWSRVFKARADQVREARAFLRAALEGCPAAHDAVLCVSELVTNAVLHSDSRKAGGIFTVRAEVHPGDYLWVEVEDSGGPWDKRAHSDGRPHGLDIVGALASAWGIDGDQLTGWVVWARLDLPPAEPPHPASQGTVTAPTSEPAQPTETTSQAITGLRDALSALGIATTGMTWPATPASSTQNTAPSSATTPACTGGPPAAGTPTGPSTPSMTPATPPAPPAGSPCTSSRPPGGALRMPDIIPGGPPAARHTAGTGVIGRGWFQHLQALEDAIAYRRARASGPCPDCTASGRTCDDHACDLQLIAAYQQAAITAIEEMSHRTPLVDHDHGRFRHMWRNLP